ncbi:MAG: spondin domain-containing protein, partial [Planctomycetota bacterium]
MLWKSSIVAVGLATASAGAQEVQVTFENLLAPGSTAFTPVFFGLSDGSFDLFDPGSAASPGLELVAEVGVTGTLESEFAAAAPGGLSDTTGLVTGGTSDSVTFNVGDPTVNRFLSFATMVVPTNDLFIGNGNNLGIEVFDAAGNFNGPITIDIFGSQVWDAGTEVNDADNGAAFLQGIDGSLGADQNGVVELFFNDPNADAYLASLLGRTTAPGFDIESTFTSSTPIARLTIVPEPASAGLL